MKKRQLEVLRLHKEVISNLKQTQITGGKLRRETNGDRCSVGCTHTCGGVGGSCTPQ